MLNSRTSLLASASLALCLPVMVASAPGAYAVGMPQLDFANPLVTGQVIWGAAIFLVFYLLLSKSALPKVEKVLANRRKRIEGDLDIAQDAKAKADHAVAELLEARRAAAHEAQTNVDKVLEEARLSAAQKTEEMNLRLNAELKDAERRVSAARETALASVRQIAGETAQTLVHQLTGANVEQALLGKKVDDAATARGL